MTKKNHNNDANKRQAKRKENAKTRSAYLMGKPSILNYQGATVFRNGQFVKSCAPDDDVFKAVFGAKPSQGASQYDEVVVCDPGVDWTNNEIKAMEQQTGYNFMPDFARAERLSGLDGIRETYQMAVAGYRDEGKPDAAALSVLEVELNYKGWEWWQKDDATAQVYFDLYEQQRVWNGNYASTHPEFAKIWHSIAYS